MSINIISNRINRLVPTLARPFTTHKLVEELIKYHKTEWDNFVQSYARDGRTIEEQEQIAVQQVGRYLGRNVRILEIVQGERKTCTIIRGLIGRHNPRETTEWLQSNKK